MLLLVFMTQLTFLWCLTYYFYGIMTTLLFDTVGWVTERHLACKNVFHKNFQRFAFQDPTKYILGCHLGWMI